MEDIDNFPFDSLEDFEKAVGSFLTEEKASQYAFAFAPPIHTSHLEYIPSMESPRGAVEEEKRKSPYARTSHATKECLEEMSRMEARLEEKMEQLHTLYFYVIDKIKQLEKNINK
jgi:cystathionine beta-lyase/cystathionine gamma-synthase